MKINKDKRLFVVNEFYESSNNFNNCIAFEDIKELKSKAQILDKFDAKIYKLL
jgi:hypothetical protein